MFRLRANHTTFRREVIGGLTTFMTMAYIVIVNPAILELGAKMDFQAVMGATCLASAFATLMMGLVARYPIALAPGMGLNAFFSFEICAAMGVPWQVALGMVFISGAVFTILTLLRVREMILEAIPECLKLATAAGIGLFIAFIGLEHAGVIDIDSETLVTMGNLRRPATLLALGGLALTAILLARKVRGAIIIGILASGVVALATGMVRFTGLTGLPPVGKVFGRLDILGAFRLEYIAPIVVLLFFDMFDTIGTLIGVSSQAGFLRHGKLPRATQALLSDSVGTMVGAATGTCTVTSYIESAAGVAEGARTGLANVVTALLFVVAFFFAPLAQMFGSGVAVSRTVQVAGELEQYTVLLYPVTAPALIVVGFLMMSNVGRIKWSQVTEGIPAFLTIILMPLTFSISHGLAIGFISYPLLKALSGQARKVHWLIYALAGLFVLRYIFLPL
ncbi:MAG: NCS2 family permease [Actinobacteria bacterium]|nr:NCS2 family permease [Actinomycetota bacterium]